MNEGQKVLVIRYGANIISDCIEKHTEVVDECGYCWFGKIGTSPSVKVLDAVLKEEEPMIILYSKGNAYRASLLEISKEKPMEAYPDYYNEYLYSKELYPAIYFKITDIQKMDVHELEEYSVASSGNKLISTLYSSMSSFFLAQYGKSIAVMKKQKDKEFTNQTTGNSRDCKFLEDGHCRNKRCINYQYECIHPELCIKRTI